MAGGLDIPFRPLRRHLVWSTAPCPADRPWAWWADRPLYLRPESGGALLCPCDESLVELPPRGRQPDSDDPRSWRAWPARLKELVPALAEAAQSPGCGAACAPSPRTGASCWAPTRCNPALFWVAGLGGHGMTSGLAVGQLAARSILGKNSTGTLDPGTLLAALMVNEDTLWFIPALSSPAPWPPASPWEDFVQRRRAADPRYGPVGALRAPGGLQPPGQGRRPGLPEALHRRRLHLEPLSRRRPGPVDPPGLGRGAHWLLLSPAGEEAGDGAGRPKGEEVLDAIHAAGAKPRWEAREAVPAGAPGPGRGPAGGAGPGLPVAAGTAAGPGPGRQGAGPGLACGARGPRRPGSQSRISLARRRGRPWPTTCTGGGRHLREDHRACPAGNGRPWPWPPTWPTGTWASPAACASSAPRPPAAWSRPCARIPTTWTWPRSGWRPTDAAGLPLEHLAGLCLPVPGDPWPDPGMVSRLLEPSLRAQGLERRPEAPGRPGSPGARRNP